MTKHLSRIGMHLRVVPLALVLVGTDRSLCHAQSSATITGDHAEVVAGDPLTLHLTFNTAATCDHGINLPLYNSDAAQEFNLQGILKMGQTTADITVVIAKDAAGKFVSNTPNIQPTLNPCTGYSAYKPFATPVISVNVRPVPDLNSYPGSAAIKLTLTQKQFLGTKIAELNSLSSAVDTRLEVNARDSIELRAFLAGIVERAEVYLTRTEREYKTQLLKPDEALPAFFADFRKQYLDLHTELRAPIPGILAGTPMHAHLIYAQQTLKPRPSSRDQQRSGNRSGTDPIAAKGVKSIMNDNASAYQIIERTGHATFHAYFESIPAGATLYYRQAIEPEYKAWSKTTNIPGTDFTLARFVFKFHKDDYEDEPVITLDPYENTTTDHEVSVEFRRRKKNQ